MSHGEPIRGAELRSMLRSGALSARASTHGVDDMEQRQVLTLAEVADLLRVERHHVAKLIKCGLPCRRLGSRHRFVRNQVMAWLETQKETE